MDINFQNNFNCFSVSDINYTAREIGYYGKIIAEWILWIEYNPAKISVYPLGNSQINLPKGEDISMAFPSIHSLQAKPAELVSEVKNILNCHGSLYRSKSEWNSILISLFSNAILIKRIINE